MELHFLPPVIINKTDNVEIVKRMLHEIMTDYYTAHLNSQ